MRCRILLVVAVVFCGAVALLVAADPVAKKEDPAEKVRKQFYRCWLETEEMDAGVRVTDPEKLNGCEFDPSYWASWGRRGELSQGVRKPGPKLDPTADPMRVDMWGEGQSKSFGGDKGDQIVPVVRPCIFKFDGENLVIAYGETWVVEKEFKKGEDYPERPKGFKSTKENKLTVSTMKPCAKWDQD